MRFIHVAQLGGIDRGVELLLDVGERIGGGGGVWESTGAAMRPAAASTVAARIVLRMIRPHGLLPGS